MSAVIAAPSKMLNAFEIARAQTHNPYAPAVNHESDSDSASIGFEERITPFKAPVAASQTVSPLPPVTESLSRESMVSMLSMAMSYMPFADIQVARQASDVFADAAERVAPQPFGRSDVTFVRWEPTEVPHPIKLPVIRRSIPGAPSNFSWRCLACGHMTFGPRCCATCRAPISTASCRVFLGQLRKDLTAELTAYMLQSLLPEINILHIESHTNPNDGRGKGCAWVYVDTVEEALMITQLHKRIFVDVDAKGAEGFWFVENAELIPALAHLADAMGALRGRSTILPRQPMVAELPGKSLLAEIVENGQC